VYLYALTHTPGAAGAERLADLTGQLADAAKTATGLELAAYQRVVGASVGATTLYASVDSYAAFGSARAAIGSDARCREIMELLAAASAGPPDAHLLEIPVGPAPELLGLLTVDTGLARLERMNDAIGFALSMAQIISKDAGQTAVFAADMYGPLGSVAWITPAADDAELDEQAAAIMGDEKYKAMMSESPVLFDAERFDRRLDQRLG
jgi:hypothetical protein